MNSVRLGKKVLFVSFAITCALFISWRLLKATTPEDNPIAIETKFHDLDKENESFFKSGLFLTAKGLLIKPEKPVALQDSVVKASLTKLNGSGKPVAYLLCDELYVIDKSCKVLGLADSMQFMDLPVISVEKPLITKSSFQFACKEIEQAVDLIKYIEKVNPLLAARLSEVNIDDSLGLVTFFDWAKGIYVVFGRGDVGNKIKNLESFYQELGRSNLIHITKSLDLRYDGRIILKKIKV